MSIPGHTALETVRISKSVKTIHSYAFKWCSALENVYIESDNLNRNILGLGEEVFCNCTSLETITLPASVPGIPKGCFSGCENLKNVELQYDGRRSYYNFYDKAFEDCISL